MSGALRNALAVALLAVVAIGVSLGAAELVVRRLDERCEYDDEVRALACEAGVTADGFNIYYLGESSMVGVPYDPRMSIPRLLEYAFDGRIGERPIHSVNLARSGQDLAFNIERLDIVLADPEHFHASLVVAYVGHNEFLAMNAPHLVSHEGPHAWQRWLARSHLLEWIERRVQRAYPLDMDERARFDQAEGSAAAIESVYERYEAGLEHVVDAAAEADVPVLLSTVAGNLADFEPSRSIYCGPAERRDEFESLLDAAADAARAGRDDEALAKWSAAEVLCDRFAELEFRRARLLERRGDRAAAAADYQAALDHDGTPLRASTRTNEAVRRIGAAHGVPVADPVARLAALGPQPAPGYDWFVDAHHANVAGFVWIAREMAVAIQARFAPRQALRSLEPAEAVAHFGLDDPAFVFDKLVERGRWFTRIATLRFDPADRLARARAAFSDAAAMRPEAADPRLGLAMVAYLSRDPGSGDREIEAARRLDSPRTDAYLQTPWVNAVVARARVASRLAEGDPARPDRAAANLRGGATR